MARNMHPDDRIGREWIEVTKLSDSERVFISRDEPFETRTEPFEEFPLAGGWRTDFNGIRSRASAPVILPAMLALIAALIALSVALKLPPTLPR